MKTFGNDAVGYAAWLLRWSDTSLSADEHSGLLHGGRRFFQSDAQGVRREAIRFYLWIANKFVKKDEHLSGEALEEKARFVLASDFFKVGSPWYEWPFWIDICGLEARDLRMALISFLCCSGQGKQAGVPFYKWNFQYCDSQIASPDKHRRDEYVISELFGMLVFSVLDSERAVPSHMKQNESRFLAFEPFRGIILGEAFARAPWLLLMYQLGEGDVKFLESILESDPEACPRVFDVRVQNLPHQAFTTQSETLAVLKARLAAPVTA